MIPFFAIFPYAYFLRTRLKGKFQRVSWIFVYFAPLIFLFTEVCHPVSTQGALIALLGFLILNYVYENGYIENDVQTIRTEKNPTLRLEERERQAMTARYGYIVLIRSLLYVFLISLYFFFVFSAQGINGNPFALPVASVVLQGCYFFYNRIRGRGNLFFLPLMAWIRFYGALLPFVGKDHLLVLFIFGMFLYPVPKLLEFLKRKRYRFEKIDRWMGNIDFFRIKYYGVLSVLLLGLSRIMPGAVLAPYLFVSLYYFVFRLLGVVVLSRKSINAEFKDNFGRE